MSNSKLKRKSAKKIKFIQEIIDASDRAKKSKIKKDIVLVKLSGHKTELELKIYLSKSQFNQILVNLLELR